jgi:hypothetical protein
MNPALHSTGRWLVACALAVIFGFFVGLTQDRNASLPGSSGSRIQWPVDSWAHR